MSNTSQAKCRKRERMIYTAECFRRGMSTSAIVLHLKEKYGIGETTAKASIRDANKWLTNYDDCSFIADVRARQIARSELILEKAIAQNKLKEANMIIDTLNKTLGLYENKQKIEITSNEIQFKFGGVDGENRMGEETEGTEEENL